MTTNTHCLGILSSFVDVLLINSLEMSITNSEGKPQWTAFICFCKAIQPLGSKEISSTGP